MFFDDEDLQRLFEKWASEAEDYAPKKTQFDKYMKRLEDVKIPFQKKARGIS